MNLDASQVDDREKLACCDKAKFLHRLTYAVAVVDVLIFIYMVSKYYSFFFKHADFD